MNVYPVIRRVSVKDAARVRSLRLEMLADAPLAFLERLDEAAATPHEQFRARMARGTSGRTVAQFVADAGDHLVGQVSGLADLAASDVTLVNTVYVTPAWRGTGLLRGLLASVSAWSRECGRPVLELEVVTANLRAIRAYQRMGFIDTGLRARHPHLPSLTEQIMRRPA